MSNWFKIAMKFNIIILGRPESPGNLRILPSDPESINIFVSWKRPMNIPQELLVSYDLTLTFNYSTSESLMQHQLIHNETQISSPYDFITGQCATVKFSLTASVAGSEASSSATFMDTFRELSYGRNLRPPEQKGDFQEFFAILPLPVQFLIPIKYMLNSLGCRESITEHFRLQVLVDLHYC